ncbi:MAG TPA: nitroreductase/quinone reductase family protein [Thermomicrobiales bacterium]|nr:nitroreductase/quinone reductase family protein [Thermomicrobiales bacterium]
MSNNAPPWIVRKVLNPALMFVVGRLGRGPRDAYVLSVRGRKTGAIRRVPVNVLNLNGTRYLVAPRGETDWVKNVRATRSANLRRGGRDERITLTEIEDAAKPPLIRAYLHNYAGQAKGLFEVSVESSEQELLQAAPAHPIFRLA